MKQIIQSLSNGNIELLEVPLPKIGKNQILVKTSCSLISSGTEKMLMNFGQSNLIQKASKNPERVKEVIDKISVDGPFATYDAVTKKLDQPIALGYCNVGKIVEVGSSISGFRVGDRVVSNGPHAEYVLVEKNLCAKIPDEVLDEEAVFVVLASIGLQGIRLAKPSLGETFVVCGLGLIGLLTAQLLKANGCKVLGIDIDSEKLKIANSLGIQTFNSGKINDCIEWCKEITSGIGVDGFLITASTKSNSPIDIASQACRKRGRIILIGTSGISINRSFFYEKELSFQVSCSYGPGRYDPIYEKEGVDYPIGLIRWTEKRNFEAVLEVINSKKMDFRKLITHKYNFSEAVEAYELLAKDFSAIGILFSYDDHQSKEDRIQILNKDIKKQNVYDTFSVGVIGAGNYAGRVLIPALKKTKVNLHTIVSRNGLDSTILAKKFNFGVSGTDPKYIFKNKEINSVFILSRHNSHAEFIVNALKNGKNVFVEKPLCISEDQFKLIIKSYKDSRNSDGTGPLLMVGFNRRFSSLIKLLKKELNNNKSPKAFTFTCNAGFLDKDHWTNDIEIGGGRLIGEACHFLDLITYLADSTIEYIDIVKAKDSKNSPDTFSINVRFEDDSIGNINYFANGNKKFPKERLDIFSSGKIYQINNFIELKTWGSSNLKSIKRLRQDKGQQACINSFIDAVKNSKKSPISFDEICELQRWLLLTNKKK